MQGLNLKECKKIEEDEKSATFHHPKGHQIKIAKSVLTPRMRENLESLPLHKAHGGDVFKEHKKHSEKASDKEHDKTIKENHGIDRENHQNFMKNHEEMMRKTEPKMMADGGEAENHPPEESNAPDPSHGVNININASPQPQGAPQPVVQPAPILQPQVHVPAAPVAPPVPPLVAQAASPAPQPQPAQDEFQTTDYHEPENVTKALNTPSPMQSMQEQFAQAKAQHNQELMKQNDAFEQDLVNGHIQPKTYQQLFSDKSTLGKIGTLFGLLVGGAGSGLAHQDNAVLKMMDQQIKNDLEGQIHSKENAQNFLRINQADLANKTAAINTSESAKTQALARTQAQMYQTSFHSLLTKANSLPPAQQAKFKQALMVMYPELKNKINNINDLASGAMASQGTNPFQPQSPQGGGSVKNSQKPGKPSYSDQHILQPWAQDEFKRAQYNPQYNDDKDEVKKQLEQASQADKAIDAIIKHFPEMVANIKNIKHPSGEYGPDQMAAGPGQTLHNAGNKLWDIGSDISGYVNRHSENLRQIPGEDFISGASRLLGAAGEMVTDSQKNRDFNVHREAMATAMSAALTNAGLTPTKAQEVIKSIIPEIGDTPKMSKDKMETAIEKMKNATTFNALNRHHLTK